MTPSQETVRDGHQMYDRQERSRLATIRRQMGTFVVLNLLGPAIVYTGMTSKSAAAEAEFTRFVQQAAPSLLRTAWLLCGDEGRAEDLVQDALGRVYLKWGSVRDRQPTAYARKAIVNAHTDRWRRRTPEVLSPTAPDGRMETAGVEAIHSREVLLTALRKLPNREREVVVLRYYVDLSEREVAEMLGISVGSVKSSASRGLATLRAGISAKEFLS